mgnify:CR=1 FL=1
MKDELIVFSKPKSNISEDIRTIRTKYYLLLVQYLEKERVL